MKLFLILKKTGIPLWLRGQRVCHSVGDLSSIPGVGKIPWRRKWQPTPVFLPGKSHGWSSLAGYSFFFKLRLILVCTWWKRFQGTLLRMDNLIWKLDKPVFC